MASMTDETERGLLDGFLGITQYTTAPAAYIALFTADPTDTGSIVNEQTGAGYTRASLAGAFTAATGTTGISTNTADVIFPVATGDWVNSTHAGIMKTGVTGTADMVLVVQLPAPVITLLGEQFAFLVGDLTLTLA